MTNPSSDHVAGAERAPERIWVDPQGLFSAMSKNVRLRWPLYGAEEERVPDAVEYVRVDVADLSRAPALAEECERLKRELAEVDALIEQYGIDTVGTGSGQTKKEDRRVSDLVEMCCQRHNNRILAASKGDTDASL